jgi:hypothetical protein
MDENPYQSPESQGGVPRRGRIVLRIALIALGLFAIAGMLAFLAIPMGMIQRR